MIGLVESVLAWLAWKSKKGHFWGRRTFEEN